MEEWKTKKSLCHTECIPQNPKVPCWSTDFFGWSNRQVLIIQSWDSHLEALLETQTDSINRLTFYRQIIGFGSSKLIFWNSCWWSLLEEFHLFNHLAIVHQISNKKESNDLSKRGAEIVKAPEKIYALAPINLSKTPIFSLCARNWHLHNCIEEFLCKCPSPKQQGDGTNSRWKIPKPPKNHPKRRNLATCRELTYPL